MEIAGRRFLVTGGSGFIGSHVVDALIELEPARVVVFDQEPRVDNLERALASRRVEIVEGDVAVREDVAQTTDEIDGVFHLAVLPLAACEANPRACLEANVVGSFNVFECARAAGVEKVVFSSASSVYGDTNETMDESHPLHARTMYGASKIAGEYFLRALGEAGRLDYVILRYMNVYGPRQASGLIPSVLARIRSGQPPVIVGDGTQSFDFVHVADVAAANVRAMASSVSREVFNVGSGTEATVREVVEGLLRLTGSPLELEFRRDADVLMTRRVGSNARAVELLGWRPSHTLATGLQTVIERDSSP